MGSDSIITTWQQFRQKTDSKGCKLTQRLGDFPNSILVTGCQRSGTTMLSRIITQSEGMVNYWFGQDDELDAALILAGHVAHEPRGRYCFQTTYLDARHGEYYEQKGEFKLIWVLRNPFSVVHSLLNNWPVSALNYTFRVCGSHALRGVDYWRYKLFGIQAVSRLHRACLVYNAKVSQIFDLSPALGNEKMMIIDYDDLVRHKMTVLPLIYDFVELEYKPAYAELIHTRSLNKANDLSTEEKAKINALSYPVYQQARQFLSADSAGNVSSLRGHERSP